MVTIRDVWAGGDEVVRDGRAVVEVKVVVERGAVER